ncbi:MAG: 2-amino-4-hydroxy-6-hydroxymethyldihydropteridine diphosphokinase [Halieaceae bacterium]
MNLVYLGVGSNIEPHANISIGLDVLRDQFGMRRASSAYESAALGFDGPAFINLAVELQTDLGLAELAAELRAFEHRMGRPQRASRFSSRTLDLDILSYGELSGQVAGVQLPRAEITENAYVLAPLAELAPAGVHPLLKVSYAQLWAEYDRARQPLQQLTFAHGDWVLPAEV